MHCSRIDSNSREARILAFLRSRNGARASTLEIETACGTVCGSTFVASLRRRLPPGETIPKAEREQTEDGRRWYYRLVKA